MYTAALSAQKELIVLMIFVSMIVHQSGILIKEIFE